MNSVVEADLGYKGDPKVRDDTVCNNIFMVLLHEENVVSIEMTSFQHTASPYLIWPPAIAMYSTF